MREQDVEQIRRAFRPGVRIVLREMAGEPQMRPGLKGNVRFVDDIGQVHMRWENGSRLALHPFEDAFQVEEKMIDVILVSPGEAPRVIQIAQDPEAIRELVGGRTEQMPAGEGVVLLRCRDERDGGAEPNVLLFDDDGKLADVVTGDALLCYVPEGGVLCESMPRDMQEKLLDAFSLYGRNRGGRKRTEREEEMER